MGDERVNVSISVAVSECRWGGPATDACWHPSACGCFPTTVEEVWNEAHADALGRLGREVFDALAEALRLPQFADWLSRRLA